VRSPVARNNDPRKIALLVALLVVLVGAIVYRLRPALVQNIVSGQAKVPKAGIYDVPTLGWNPDATRAVPTPGSSRSLFAYGPPPTPTPDLRPTPTPMPTLPPRPVIIPTPPGISLADGNRLPLPPPFPWSYIGWLGPDRLPVAVFLDGGDVVVVPRGDTIKSRFVLRDVGPNDVVIGFVGYPDSVTRKVPIAP
jgi:hypothetical protein